MGLNALIALLKTGLQYVLEHPEMSDRVLGYLLALLDRFHSPAGVKPHMGVAANAGVQHVIPVDAIEESGKGVPPTDPEDFAVFAESL